MDKSHVYININGFKNEGESMTDCLKGTMVRGDFSDHVPGNNYFSTLSSWFGKALATCPIGNIIEASVDGKTFKVLKTYGGWWNNGEDRMRWQGQTRANEIKIKVESQGKKDKYKDLDEHIEELKRTYQTISIGDREAFLAHIIARLTGRTPAKRKSD